MVLQYEESMRLPLDNESDNDINKFTHYWVD